MRKMDDKFKKIIEEINMNKELNKKYLINDLIKIRVHRLLKNTKLPRCGFHDCNLPVDYTEGLGLDTSCPYHRLLFDWWLYNYAKHPVGLYSKKGKRSAFTQWVNKTGKKECNRIVDWMSKDPINWKC